MPRDKIHPGTPDECLAGQGGPLKCPGRRCDDVIKIGEELVQLDAVFERRPTLENEDWARGREELSGASDDLQLCTLDVDLDDVGHQATFARIGVEGNT